MLNIEVRQENAGAPVAVVGLEGELDAATYLDVIAEARELVAQGTTNILLDLSGLTYMGSSGLFALHSVAMLLRGEEPPDPEGGWSGSTKPPGDETSRSISSCFAAAQVDRVLERSGMKRFFETFTDGPRRLPLSEDELEVLYRASQTIGASLDAHEIRDSPRYRGTARHPVRRGRSPVGQRATRPWLGGSAALIERVRQSGQPEYTDRAMCVPLTSGEKPLGVVVLWREAGTEPFTAS